eukprot:284979-Prymnesium_polylepis.1
MRHTLGAPACTTRASSAQSPPTRRAACLCLPPQTTRLVSAGDARSGPVSLVRRSGRATSA